MNRSAIYLAAAVAASAVSAQAPAPAPEKLTVTKVLDASFARAEGNFVPAVEAMPEAQFSFAPTQGEFKGVRTFLAQVKHVAAVNNMLAAAILGDKLAPDLAMGAGPDTVKTKAEAVAYLKASYAYAHKAMATINDQNTVDPIPSPFGPKPLTRLAMAELLLAHTMDHYGQLAIYLRMNGIVPPASRSAM